MTLLTIGVWVIILLILAFLLELRRAMRPPVPARPLIRRNWLGALFAVWLLVLAYHWIASWLR